MLCHPNLALKMHFLCIFVASKYNSSVLLRLIMITIVGVIAAILTTSAMFPQAMKIIKSRNVSSISLLMYIVHSLGVFMWFLYGILLENYVLIFTNVVAIVPTLTILTLKIVLGNKKENGDVR
jgi:MtN3 and saliva related transmembrane protein